MRSRSRLSEGPLDPSAWLLRSAGGGVLWVPPMSEARLVGTREKDFSMSVPRMWNFLPREAVLASALAGFH